MLTNIRKSTRESVIEVSRLLEKGEVIVCGTDSIYAFYASIYHESAIKRIFELKQRSHNQALQVIIKPEDAAQFTQLDVWQHEVIKQLLPAPISFIVPNRTIPFYVNGGLDTISLVWQNNWVMQQLYELSGPYVGTSANLHGQPSPLTVEEAVAYFRDQVPLYLDTGPAKFGIPNTIIDLTKTPIELIREGYYNLADVNRLIGERVSQKR